MTKPPAVLELFACFGSHLDGFLDVMLALPYNIQICIGFLISLQLTAHNTLPAPHARLRADNLTSLRRRSILRLQCLETISPWVANVSGYFPPGTFVFPAGALDFRPWSASIFPFIQEVSIEKMSSEVLTVGGNDQTYKVTDVYYWFSQ